MQQLDALHSPDMIAGGKDKVRVWAMLVSIVLLVANGEKTGVWMKWMIMLKK